jgi:hypothetical protein
MKKVNSPQDTAHLFATQSQIEARTPNGSLYFYDKSIFSYGSHFCIAKFVDSKTLLFTERTYSNTTAKHISCVSYATSHINKIYCSNPNGSHENNFNVWLNIAEQLTQKLSRANKPEIYISQLQQIENKAKIYANYFNIEIPKTLQSVLTVTTKAEILAYMENKAELIKAEKIAKQKAELKNHKIQLKKWRNFETSRLYTRTENVDYLRKDAEFFQTSQGVKIPLEIGMRLYKNLANVKVNDKFLDYTVGEVTKQFICIGCHKITFKEINNIINK